MELRVWIDGSPNVARTVCGVKLTTTVQEVVFALAHATQQAGRFTMIERWRNNERLLSPNEQPLVTLQRWGDHMNEVEFILRKTSTDTSSSSMLRNPHNGYPIHSEMPLQQSINSQPQPQPQPEQSQVSKNHPFEDLYSSINKKRNNQPPAVPAKPRVVGSIAPVASIPPMQLNSVSSAQMNFYHPNQTPLNTLYSSNIRPRHPPGYLDYMEALANRNSLPHQLMTNPTYAQQSHHNQSNMFQQRPYDSQQVYSIQQNGSSPNGSSANNRYRYSVNGPLPPTNYDQNQEMRPSSSMQNIRPKLIEPGLVINRGSAVNVKLTPSSHNLPLNQQISTDRHGDNATSVSQMGHDMLKVIEEQKKVLVNQKNELDRLDNDQEYWETKQNSEQAELINLIENEIHQLEELWKKNQAQIKKLENQDFEKELQELKSDQVKMELEISKQKRKLQSCENDIASCKSKIEKLESELANQAQGDEDDSLSSSTSSNGEPDELFMNILKSRLKEEAVEPEKESRTIHSNGILTNNGQHDKETKSSEDEEDDSAGDASDDLNLPSQDRTRTAKDVAYVDKRGLISGIRSLKLDKSRALNRHAETIRSTENIGLLPTTSSLSSKDEVSINDVDKRSSENNNQYPDKAANNNNKYEFLMSL